VRAHGIAERFGVRRDCAGVRDGRRDAEGS
jgi:hypothetical protein